VHLRPREKAPLEGADAELLRLVLAALPAAEARAAGAGSTTEEEIAHAGRLGLPARLLRLAATGPGSDRFALDGWRQRAAFALTRAAAAGLGELTLEESLALRSATHARIREETRGR